MIEPLGYPAFIPTAHPVFGPSCHQSVASGPNDLVAALLMFAFVGMLFAAVLLYPVLRDAEEEKEADREEASQVRQSDQARQDTMRMEFLSQASEHARQNDPTEKWIHGR